MRLTIAVCALLILSGIVCGQTNIVSPDEMIRQIIDLGMVDGHMHKQIGVMGDAAAVTVTKVLAGRTLRTNDIDSALIVLHMSFAGPRSVENVADREPRTALFILKCFDNSTTDPKLKERIAETRRYVQEQAAKAKK